MERLVFHLDCYGIIPECAFCCDGCISEMNEVLTALDGVNKFYTEGEAENMLFVVECDPEKISSQQLLDIFAGLPTNYQGFFKPSLAEQN